MKTFIEIWHTDKGGWKSNYFATRGLDYDEKGRLLGYNWWQIDNNLTHIQHQDDIESLRKLLDAIEEEITE